MNLWMTSPFLKIFIAKSKMLYVYNFNISEIFNHDFYKNIFLI